MPVTVLKTGTKIHVEFNEYTQHAETRKACFPDTGILAVMLKDLGAGEYVEVHVSSPDNKWYLSLGDVDNTLVIDTINGVNPADIDDLQEKLCDLMA